MSYIVRSTLNPKLILCTGNVWRPETQVGPGGYNAKLYKTETGAKKVRDGNVIVEPYPSSSSSPSARDTARK